MKTMKLVALATTASAGTFGLAGTASAQSTGSATVDTVVITGSSGPANSAGMIQAETVAKSRTTITNEFIETQTPGQTILQNLNIVTPGLNFTNNDPYGTSGGNIRLHGFDGNRVALTFDGMPLNDTGNYAVFTNQLLDGELIASAQVNTGSTDVDSPTAASSGGTINFASRTPSTKPGAWGQYGIGDFAYNRYMVFGETGEVGPWGTRAWAAYSDTQYDKFKGPGHLDKKQFNAKIYQPLGDGKDFISMAVHYNQNRNNNYYSVNLDRLNSDGSINTPAEVETNPDGWKTDFRSIYLPDTVTTRTGFTGDIDVAENTNNGATRGWYGLRINPSNTGNVRIQSRFDLLGDKLTLTVDPSFQYVLANGGTQNTTIWESCNGATTAATPTSCPILTRQLLGTVAPANTATAGVDINGDGDINDLVRVMNPSNTNTRRIGLISSLIWHVTDDQLLRASYAYDRGRHRQTGEFSTIDQTTFFYTDVFGGKDGHGPKINTVDGQSFMRNRDRFSVAQLNQFSLEYRGKFFDALNVSVGLRAPYFERQLNQYCYSQAGTSNVRCTTETPVRTLTAANNVTANGVTTYATGNVQFGETAAPNATTGAPNGNQYIAPYSRTLKYDDLLPNVGLSYKINPDTQLYGSYAESTSLPRTDNLYTVFRLADGSIGNPDVQPETSKTFEGGVRYDANHIISSLSAWHTDFDNRIVSSFDDALGIFVDRNVGAVKQYGVDGSFGWQPVDELTLYFSGSYNHSEVQSDLRTGAATTAILPLKGKSVVETPEWTWSARTEYEIIPNLILGAQVKYVGERWVTDVNDMKVDPYTLVDANLSWKLDGFGLSNSSIRFNINNIFDTNYYGSLGTQNTARGILSSTGAVLIAGSTPFANIGSPRTATLTFRAGF